MSKTYTTNEIARTAYPWLFDDKGNDSRTNDVCPCCKGRSGESIIDEVSLEPFKKFWSGRRFRAKQCSNELCGAFWSYGVME